MRGSSLPRFISPPTVSLRGQLLKTYTSRSLSAGGRVNVGFSRSQAGLSGQYILVVIDSGSKVAESSESNNTISQKIP